MAKARASVEDSKEILYAHEHGSPKDYDVLLGRGKHGECWPGNIRFRNLIHEHALAYYTSPRADQRDAIATGIIAAIEENGGRFLQISPARVGSECPSWRALVSKAATTAKVKQALRDRMKAPVESRRRVILASPRPIQTAPRVPAWLGDIGPRPNQQDSMRFPARTVQLVGTQAPVEELHRSVFCCEPETAGDKELKPAELSGKTFDSRLMRLVTVKDSHVQAGTQLSRYGNGFQFLQTPSSFETKSNDAWNLHDEMNEAANVLQQSHFSLARRGAIQGANRGAPGLSEVRSDDLQPFHLPSLLCQKGHFAGAALTDDGDSEDDGSRSSSSTLDWDSDDLFLDDGEEDSDQSTPFL